MQANNSRAAAQLYAHDTTAGAGASSLPKLILAVVLLTAVWAFARFGHEVTAVPPIAPLTAGAFAQPQDFVATMYHALGVAPEAVMYDSLERPHQLVSGQAIHDLFV